MEFVILALALQRGGIVPRWWLGLPSLRAAGLTLAAFAALTIGSVLINLAPGCVADLPQPGRGTRHPRAIHPVGDRERPAVP
jgi:hypothetical protein